MITENKNAEMGAKAGYGSLPKIFNFPATANRPCPTLSTVRANGNLFTYHVDPVSSEHLEPFVETFGGAHSNTYQKLLKTARPIAPL